MFPSKSTKKIESCLWLESFVSYCSLANICISTGFCHLDGLFSFSPVSLADSHGVLTQIQWCIPTGGKEVGMPENLYKNVINYVLYQECSNRVGQ